MSYYAGSYRQLLFGVSQQVPKDRLDGQVEEQINMTSDLVTGPRRRAPVAAVGRISSYTDPARLARGNAKLGGVDVLLLVNAVTGSLTVANERTGAVLYTVTDPYLVATKGTSIRFASLADEVYLCNTEVLPTSTLWAGVSGIPLPKRSGYQYVLSGAFSKEYKLSITKAGVTTSVVHTTSASVAAQATPEYIATQLVTLAAANATIGTAAGFTYTREGAYIYVTAGVDFAISTDSGSLYTKASNQSSIRDVSDLPALLPNVANGYIVAVGASEQKTYYRWEDATRTWKEDAYRDDQKVLTNMPLVLTWTGSAYLLSTPAYERRAAGDAEFNPDLKFVQYGITGMGTMQGRLVLLSNEYACMSAADKPLRWYRSSVATLLDSDPIEVAANAQVSAPYTHAVQFDKNLLLFAETHQGIVPGAGVLSPRTAVASLTTNYRFQGTADPVATGRTVFFSAPRTTGYSSVWEMLPSQYTDAQVSADDVTNHIPRYIQGEVRFIAASTTSNVVVLGTGNPNELIVHEYAWSGAEKAHASWHKWEFQHPVLNAYFSGDRLNLLFGDDGTVTLCSIDLRAGAGDDGARTARLDFSVELTCAVDGELTVPDWVYELHEPDSVWLFKTLGSNAYLRERVQSASTFGLTYVLSVPAAEVGDKYVLGSRFTSMLAPTRPILKDQNQVAITIERTQLHRLLFNLANTGEVDITVEDAARPPYTYSSTPLHLFSADLDAGQPLATSANVNVPCRVDMQSAKISIRTDDVYDMNIVSLEYGYRYNQRYRRG